MWVRCYKTPELWSINTLYILQSESDTLMQKGYYCSREHTSSVPVFRARTAIPSRLHRMRQPSHSREYSAHPCEYLLCIGRSGRGADSTITYSHKWCMVLDPAIYGMGAWWFERSSWLMTLPAADRKVLCLAGERFGGPDRSSPAPLFKRFLQALVLFGYRALTELDGPLCLGQRVHDAQVRILHQLF